MFYDTFYRSLIRFTLRVFQQEQEFRESGGLLYLPCVSAWAQQMLEKIS